MDMQPLVGLVRKQSNSVSETMKRNSSFTHQSALTQCKYKKLAGVNLHACILLLNDEESD
jgi:hypothetical protein